ncbi:MAG: hypothetical protein AVDCRST_MAG19-3525 [uncultured Thermomicrobiales bacterium]|uniref:Uncharacterized protein n=1 Tax=uncultured Thermomicrobiales bacterium TaxID=1645740 RepID=A0A6J4VH28_9BACT|nr:MAG: hypothetical protein AVDCRST_MAG19-3525 [uncultured Thermomicrobiales bacterium]
MLQSNANPRSRIGGTRDGLASRGVAPTVLSGAALGHDRVRDGTGWGQRAHGHGCPRPPNKGSVRLPNGTPTVPRHTLNPVSRFLARAPHTIFHHNPSCTESPALPWNGDRRQRTLRVSDQVLPTPSHQREQHSPGREPPRPTRSSDGNRGLDDSRVRECPPSTIRTARLRSVARLPPAAYRPGRLPGVLPVETVGKLVLGRDSRLDAFSGSPVRTWLPSGAGCPTTGPPAVRPARSSRTRASAPQLPNARGG